MTCIWENGKALPCTPEEAARYAGDCLGLFPLDRAGAIPGKLPEEMLESAFASGAARFVSYEEADLICLNEINPRSPSVGARQIYVFLQKHCLQIFCGDDAILQVLSANSSSGLGGTIWALFRNLLQNDAEFLEEMEKGIAQLEDEVLESRQKNYTKKIIALRKHLMALNRYYEQLMDIFDGIEANENGLFDARTLKLLKIVDGKVGRLCQNVFHLRDYVTQIREAYEAEVGIALNKLMKVFTVVTSIFLPLTLIVGWYGMNLQMPEFNTPWAYPVLIAACAGLTCIIIASFKRNKWF